MRTRSLGWALAGLAAASCFLPDVDFDPNAGTGAGGRGSAGQSQGGSAGKGGSGGTGGGTAAQGGEGGTDLGTQIEIECGKYCDAYFAACADQPPNTYDDKADCFNTCVTSGWPLRDPDVLNAPGTIECRYNHALRAASSGVDPHCFHSAEFPSKGVCEITNP